MSGHGADSAASWHLPVLVGLEGPRLLAGEIESLQRFRPAGVVLFRRNVESTEQLEALCDEIARCLHSDDTEATLIAADHEGGAVVQLALALGEPPSPLALAWADDLELTTRVHAETARRARACGVHLILAPVADVNFPGNPVISTRAFGEDPLTVRRHVTASIQGLRVGGVLGCAKHWPGHGRPRKDSHSAATRLEVGLPEWERDELPPFAAAIEAGVETVMAGHLEAPGLDPSGSIAPLSPELLQGLLRGRLGFDGAILSDALEMVGFGAERPLAALEAGCDLLLFAAPLLQAAGQLESLEKALPEWQRTPEGRRSSQRVGGLRWRAVELGAAPWIEPDEGIYEQARGRGWRFHRGDGMPDPVFGAAPSSWWLIDGASGDRLLRLPGESEEGEPDGQILPLLSQRLGEPMKPPLMGSGQDLDAAPVLDRAGVGLILASLRPLKTDFESALLASIGQHSPAWIALLGDQSLASRLPSSLTRVQIPGVRSRDVQLAVSVLGGDIDRPQLPC